jgi:ArsR family transcriptional regulator, arsenate/arsenite/antimonite-responsive transcriptional repressor
MAGKSIKQKSNQDMERMSAAFKALSNETRMAVFENIRLCRAQAMLNKDNQPSVCNVASNINISLSTISHHIKELRNAGLVKCERQGQTIL